MYRILLNATINYGLGSYGIEELDYYNKIIKEMDDIKKRSVKNGSTLNWISLKEWINESQYFFIYSLKPYAYWPAFSDDC